MPDMVRGALDRAHASASLAGQKSLSLFTGPTPVEEMKRLRAAIGGGPRLLVKRDDAISFGFGGNKIRKLEYVAAAAMRAGADILVTIGGVQSNHARATAAVAAHLGLDCQLIANGVPPARPTANALLNELLGAKTEYVADRAEREGAAREITRRLRQVGRRPWLIPLGASTPLGAFGYAHAVDELLAQTPAPHAIVVAASSGGTLAGIAAGCAIHGLTTEVIGVSADEPAAALRATATEILRGMAESLEVSAQSLIAACRMQVSDCFVGDGYGLPSDASREAQRLAARTEALFVDHTYTAKALAALIDFVRAGLFDAGQTVLFWHTGGQVALFA